MSLQEQITQDMRKSLKEGTPAHRDALKVIVGEFQRQPSAKLSDEEVVSYPMPKGRGLPLAPFLPCGAREKSLRQ